MKQLLQSLSNGRTEIADVPCPAPAAGQLLIASARTLVSSGTERMLVDFGKASLLGKARQQPDKVRMVLEKMRTDGLIPTIESVLNKLDQPLPMGYCNVGVVREIGAGVSGFAVGDRVVSNGRHAEVVCVPTNLCAKVPEGVADDHAAFAVVGAIALQGIRLAQPTLGEAVVVTGLGLIGLLAVQLLRAHGCRVLGLDFDSRKLALARELGAEVVDLSASPDPVSAARLFSRGRGVDAVLITAASDSSEPVHQAAQMCRKRGRIVLVGVVGLELSRADFYEKELTFQVSCSYGPGRYDPAYEERGFDYPVGFVRWTEQRNFEAVLDMMAAGRLDVGPLITHRFPIDAAVEAYRLVSGAEPSLGILLEYPQSGAESTRRTVMLSNSAPSVRAGGSVALGFIGAGNYATAKLLPAFKAAGVALRCVASAAGVSGLHAARKFGIEQTTTDLEVIFGDASIAAIVISTRHDTHAELVCRSLEAGKHVYVEKPLAVTIEDLAAIERAYSRSRTDGQGGQGGKRGPMLMVGFNRRFAPQVRKIQQLLAGISGPKAFVMTVNAGAVPAEHWTQSTAVGGGRLIGEACHFIDLLRFLAGAQITGGTANRMQSATGDTVTISLRFFDGSIGTVHYLANGSKAFPKERLEVFAGGRILQLDNFRRLKGFGWPGFQSLRLWRQDKGQSACVEEFVAAVRDGRPSPIAFEELLEVGRVTIELGCGA